MHAAQPRAPALHHRGLDALRRLCALAPPPPPPHGPRSTPPPPPPSTERGRVVLALADPFFWELFEKSNAFLERAIATALEPFTDYSVTLLYDEPLPTGGTWPLYQQLFLKYGAVPAAAMPETSASRRSVHMIALIEDLLRSEAMKIRAIAAKHSGGMPLATGDGDAAAGLDAKFARRLREHKAEAMRHVYRLLAIHLGTPPKEFTWTFVNASGALHRMSHLTPLSFAEKVCASRGGWRAGGGHA